MSVSPDPTPAPPIRLSRGTGGLVVGLALLVLGVALTWSALDIRQRTREQILRQAAGILDAVTSLQHENDQTAGETLAPLSDEGEQIQLALEISKLRNVLGVRLYSASGKFRNAFPAYFSEAALSAGHLAELQALHPVGMFEPAGRLDEQLLVSEPGQGTAPLLLVEVPLRSEDSARLVGAIQFVMDGHELAGQFGQLDRHLVLRFLGVFLAGALVLAVGLGWAIRRVEKANRLLAERTQTLLEANRELSLAARVSAVGAVAAHLIHGLKNPLSGLVLLSSQRAAAIQGQDEDWQAALLTTQRMQEMVNRVVRVLQEQHSEVQYEISVGELLGLVEEKIRPLADAAGVRLETACAADRLMSNRTADLVLLILENLAQNGVEATPAGRPVRVTATESKEGLVFQVVDRGPGLPERIKSRLFTPCTSGKPGGGGIGLAISQQLAQHLGARLELAGTSTCGTIFQLVIPRDV